MHPTIKTMFLLSAALSSSLVGIACQKTAEEARTDSVEAQQQADEKIAASNEKAGEKVAAANHDVAEVKTEARENAAEAQATANEKIRDANRAAMGDKDGARSWGQKEVDSVDTMIDAAGVKAQTAAPANQSTFNRAIAGVKRDRDKLHRDLATLEVPPGDKLDKNKAQFSERADRVKDDIRNLEKAL
jgi:hypothetical protein